MACPPMTGPVLDSSIALAELAADGFGVALLPSAMFSRQIEAGRLVQPYDVAVSAGSYYLTRPVGKAMTPAMATFATWLRSELLDASDT